MNVEWFSMWERKLEIHDRNFLLFEINFRKTRGKPRWCEWKWHSRLKFILIRNWRDKKFSRCHKNFRWSTFMRSMTAFWRIKVIILLFAIMVYVVGGERKKKLWKYENQKYFHRAAHFSLEYFCLCYKTSFNDSLVN